MNVRESAVRAKTAQIELGALSGERKNRILDALIRALEEGREVLFDANRRDMERAERENLEPPLLKRLRFDEKKLSEVISGIRSLIDLPDPVGKVLEARELDSSLELYRVSAPIGVIGMIFESRPDALVQIASLALKSGNALLLKGGSEAVNTNRCMADLIAEATVAAGAPEYWIALLESREEVAELFQLDDLVDLLIPRGSKDFVRYIMQHSQIPVMGHADGICHIYIDGDADPEMAVRLVVDSKTQYPAVCNALETLLVDSRCAETLLPRLAEELRAKGVELRGCPGVLRHIDALPADDEDWSSEYLSLILSIKLVDGLDEAIAHINRYGSGHTDAIVSSNRGKAERFMSLVDSADLFWNCSTRFADGYRFGLGAEVGISTNKVHARGPVGLDGLMIYKWRLYGEGQCVADYSGGGKHFLHRDLQGGKA